MEATVMNTIQVTTARRNGAFRRKRAGFWIRRVYLVVGCSLALLAIGGVIYQLVATASDQRRYPPPGKLVDVGGYRLHLYCVGAGSPTVILDHVGAGSVAQWGLIQPEIAKTTRVC